MDLLIKNANIIALDDQDSIVEGSVYIRDGIISAIGRVEKAIKSVCKVIDAEGGFLLPGFVQTHVHTGQTLFRGMADDVDLLTWLSRYIWPLEAAHNSSSVYASARLSMLEMLSSGTTTYMDMGLVKNLDFIVKAAEESGMRAVIAKMLMDSGEGLPSSLVESLSVSEAEVRGLVKNYHAKGDNRIRIALGPRFALSSKRESLIRASEIARDLGIMITTHSSENIKEILAVRDISGRSNIAYLDECGIIDRNSVIAHCIWLQKEDFSILKERGASVAHCPSANMKLASGFARIPEMMDYGINVSLGADGAPCNNNLSILREIRHSALIHKPRTGPKKMDAKTVLKMATIYGAKALGMEKEIGSIELGKKADLIIINRNSVHVNPVDNPYSAVVYSAQEADIKCVIIDGRVVLKDGRHYLWDTEEVVVRADEEKRRLLRRV